MPMGWKYLCANTQGCPWVGWSGWDLNETLHDVHIDSMLPLDSLETGVLSPQLA